ncbi:MAG TPA: nuclear transport factor 2 family protein, partial [Rheinheimera sp.]|nr:nuclear transport factor 2 family protein [Rheinheimera sp.]
QNELITYHRDYYDLTEMVYQHLPIIGWLTAKVKQRMSSGK